MKKLLICAGMAVLLAASCVTNVAYVADESIPLDYSTLVFTGIGTITRYNGIPVYWKQGIMTAARIPAGETQLLWDIYQKGYRDIYQKEYQGFIGKNMLLQYTFLPQKKYYFEVGRENSLWGVRIYMYDIDERLHGLREHYVEFVPFLNSSGGKTILN